MIIKPQKTETVLKNKNRYKFTLPLLTLDFWILIFLGYKLDFPNAVMIILSIFFILVLLVYIYSIKASTKFILIAYCDPLSYLKINKAGEG